MDSTIPIIAHKYQNFKSFQVTSEQIYLFPDYNERNLKKESILEFYQIKLEDLCNSVQEYQNDNEAYKKSHQIELKKIELDMDEFEINCDKGISSIKIDKVVDDNKVNDYYLLMVDNKIMSIKINLEQLVSREEDED